MVNVFKTKMDAFNGRSRNNAKKIIDMIKNAPKEPLRPIREEAFPSIEVSKANSRLDDSILSRKTKSSNNSMNLGDLSISGGGCNPNKSFNIGNNADLLLAGLNKKTQMKSTTTDPKFRTIRTSFNNRISMKGNNNQSGNMNPQMGFVPLLAGLNTNVQQPKMLRAQSTMTVFARTNSRASQPPAGEISYYKPLSHQASEYRERDVVIPFENYQDNQKKNYLNIPNWY